jgi:predicted membrane-bound spermidine synthase
VSHQEFIAAYQAGKVRVHIDRERAAKLLSARLMLPFVLLPLLGLAVALALTGYLIAGIALFLLVFAFRYAVRASSQGFVLSRALQDPGFYEGVRAAGTLSIVGD